MSRFTFDGRVVAVTGAGRGIGRAYAVLFAQLGAQVVVNDLGGGPTGEGANTAPATKVVDRIRAAGGAAVANFSDVSTAEGGQSVIDAALAEFGRIDVVVNNAGNMVWAGLPDADLANLESHLNVHVKGSFNTARAAWPHMLEQDYGRIVLTTSIGMFGLEDNLGYATAKAAMFGMARSMTASAAGKNIKVNCIGPNALTRLAGKPGGEAASSDFKPIPELDPAAVAPMVAYLGHESCDVSGEVYLAGGGRFSRLFVGVTDGYLSPDPAHVGVEDVAANWAAINDEKGYYVPTDPVDWSAHFMAHLFPAE
ncbi:SDR family NAD(P)-dependent oxidoreductase [Frankia sp. AgB1.9]|uniref:SDR family NAD(P)-dependent oxidoreductase n=1 Tax=unclassified Frankia TaxID=2632575 RepID=UPI0019333C46|nr:MULTISPECIES: SDR family NAD(P)-dependent oxidoreductase [unclassified Frankia]MBL7493177.1 SDR family NAD(P)-dependent oxidoreductase [Frankia sp. AgW1.1]MBL7550745.1 SDR family NAD(P)-dependent oxidoreductase [Frankia sp. AgB1.9]MBL7624362.1 SDR family NAD(P)-dependent oxidoreductase [Frankia sp. AgB1.8]